MARSIFATRKRRSSFVDRYLNAPMSYGGIMSTRGEIIRDLREQGMDWAYIDRYLQGADLRVELEKRDQQWNAMQTEMIQ